METIEHNGRRLGFYPLHGEVVKIDDSTITTVHGHGGDSHTDLEGKFAVRPMSISSQVHYEREVWIKDEQGKEHTIALNNKSIKLREGNLVTFGIVEGKNSQSLIALKNHTTDSDYRLTSNEEVVDGYNFSIKSQEMGIFMWLGVVVLVAVANFYFVRTLVVETSLGDFLSSLTGAMEVLAIITVWGIIIGVPCSVLFYAVRRIDRIIKNHNEAINKVKRARAEIMSAPHPEMATN